MLSSISPLLLIKGLHRLNIQPLIRENTFWFSMGSSKNTGLFTAVVALLFVGFPSVEAIVSDSDPSDSGVLDFLKGNHSIFCELNSELYNDSEDNSRNYFKHVFRKTTVNSCQGCQLNISNGVWL